jgi:GT2 family glycosyltransferase
LIPVVVPVLSRFDLFAGFIKSIDVEFKPIIIDNWVYNRGVAASWNEGMRNVIINKYRYALISNDDVILNPGTINKLYDSMIETGACIISANPNGKFESSGLLKNEEDFFCFMVDVPQLINNCGIFDENFYPAYFEDNDMRYRMKLANVKSYLNTDAIAFHYGSATQNADMSNRIVSDKQFQVNEKYFFDKWGGLPWEETYLTPFNDSSKNIWDWKNNEII